VGAQFSGIQLESLWTTDGLTIELNFYKYDHDTDWAENYGEMPSAV
jgi:hypothetical protein